MFTLRYSCGRKDTHNQNASVTFEQERSDTSAFCSWRPGLGVAHSEIMFREFALILLISAALGPCAQAADSCSDIFHSSNISTRLRLTSIERTYRPNFEQSLKLHYAPAIRDLYSSDGTKNAVFRGHSDPNFNLAGLAGLLRGSRDHELRSWNYSRALAKKLSSGQSSEVALAETDLEIAQSIERDIQRTSPWGYLVDQYNGTGAGKPIDTKSGTSLPGAVGEAALGTAMRYSIGQMREGRLNNKASYRPLVFEIDPAKAPGLPWAVDREFFFFSHVSGKAIKRIIIGVPNGREQTTRTENYDWISISRSKATEALVVDRLTIETNDKVVSIQKSSRLALITRRNVQIYPAFRKFAQETSAASEFLNETLLIKARDDKN